MKYPTEYRTIVIIYRTKSDVNHRFSRLVVLGQKQIRKYRFILHSSSTESPFGNPLYKLGNGVYFRSIKRGTPLSVPLYLFTAAPTLPSTAAFGPRQ